ncbi:iron(III) transport system ATP-binding protein [Nocardioides terrae]|uniref:Iron(III) transport system ATP-binding protein n=1 Tax=Nocardioides terrae TaxID=574651 RepID=A0A1I1EF82_9ACTN|nr:ABC transporter ATP-binding protein [Nocardioides terrae]SFB85687.1 iron(III) transport system ATP-binding protein [Nocardioides terrae]
MLEVSRLRKTFETDGQRALGRGRRTVNDVAQVFAVNDVSFTVEEGEMFTLLGPSGCGKTTTLRSIAGLETPDSGSIALDGRALFSRQAGKKKGAVNVAVNKRGLGMVFQSYAIWPHMSVFDNVAFPLRVAPRGRRVGEAEVKRRVTKVLETMELAAYADRHATKLSGGQQQRLALARAIVIEPPLLLLDEPLSNLDAKLRESLRYELKRLQRELGITSIYVTHDQTEALALSSKVAVMQAGQVAQLGTPREIYQRPLTKFVAEFIGTANFLDGTVRARSGQDFAVETANGVLTLTADADVTVGSAALASIRPESVQISVERPTDARNVWSGVVTTRAFLGEAMDHIVSVGQHEINVRSGPEISIEPGTPVYIRFDPSKLSLVPMS